MDEPLIHEMPGRYGASKRNRAVSLALALLTSLLLFATLIAMGQFDVPGGGRGTQLTAISISGEKAQTQAKRAVQPKSQHVAATSAAAPLAKIPPPIVPTTNTMQMPEGFIQLSRADMASSDIGRMRSAAPSGSGSGTAGGGGGSGDGEGPGGAHLYKAEWYREPTNAEIDGYASKRAVPGDWGVIMCRTAEKFRVEDCREKAESPGSGMARMLRQASWQFLVRPPREDGRPLIGVWVSIRFDIIKSRKDAPEGG